MPFLKLAAKAPATKLSEKEMNLQAPTFQVLSQFHHWNLRIPHPMSPQTKNSRPS